MNVEPSKIAANLAGVHQRIAAAAARSGRSADGVRLVAVTKYVDVPAVEALVAAGCCDLGESRPQELWRKAAALSPQAQAAARWHLVGHLQRNKVRRTLPLVVMIQSCDSLRLLEEIDRVAGPQGLTVAALLEVNISGDAAKHGFAPEDLPSLWPQIAELAAVQVKGLMGMAGLEGDLDDARRQFAALRELRDRWQADCPPTISLAELSMGMSRDFEVAVEEGATIVRVGSALFEEG